MRIALMEKAKAVAGGYFWLPCPCCGEEFGGHEWVTDGPLPGSVPDPAVPQQSWGICPKCTELGYGYPASVSWEIWYPDSNDIPGGIVNLPPE